MIGLILIGLLILYVISFYKMIIVIIDWETVPEAEKNRTMLIFFIITLITIIAFNVVAWW
jgi:membrane-associated HD superfamily phosphohydrolase